MSATVKNIKNRHKYKNLTQLNLIYDYGKNELYCKTSCTFINSTSKTGKHVQNSNALLKY